MIPSQTKRGTLFLFVKGWIGDIKAHTGNEVNFPLIADADRR